MREWALTRAAWKTVILMMKRQAENRLLLLDANNANSTCTIVFLRMWGGVKGVGSNTHSVLKPGIFILDLYKISHPD